MGVPFFVLLFLKLTKMALHRKKGSAGAVSLNNKNNDDDNNNHNS